MKRRGLRTVAAVVLLSASLTQPLHAGPLDLDLYAAPGKAARPATEPRYPALETWKPGDPRHLREEKPWVQYAAHAGYAGMAIAGLVASIATGGAAPAVGFGIVALVNLARAWRLKSARG